MLTHRTVKCYCTASHKVNQGNKTPFFKKKEDNSKFYSPEESHDASSILTTSGGSWDLLMGGLGLDIIR